MDVFTHLNTIDHFEGALVATERTPWWWHLWCTKTRWRLANI